jgi:2-oxoisovalerate dehydrogenase E1 component alpha subunit
MVKFLMLPLFLGGFITANKLDRAGSEEEIKMPLTKDDMREMYWMIAARPEDRRARWVLHAWGIAFQSPASGTRQAQVGAAFALRRGHEWVTPYYRDLALMISMGLYPARLHAGADG